MACLERMHRCTTNWEAKPAKQSTNADLRGKRLLKQYVHLCEIIQTWQQTAAVNWRTLSLSNNCIIVSRDELHNNDHSITRSTTTSVSHGPQRPQYHMVHDDHSITRSTTATVSHGPQRPQYHTVHDDHSITQSTTATGSHGPQRPQDHTVQTPVTYCKYSYTWCLTW